MVTAGSELTPGTSVDRRYLIQCTLGRGGFGRTYLAADERRFNELCVLKEFVPGDQVDPVVAQKLRELFQREAAILHKLDHPQIPRFFAGFEENGRLFIAQEYIDGKTYWRMLQERQRRGQAFGQSEVVCWLRDLLKVLDYLHQQGIVHRDISPDNIMLPRGGQTPVLIDFGVVKQVLPHLHLANPNDPDGLIQASVSVGKFGYAPYEQIRMGQCSPCSDLYALAVTAVVLLTGKPPNLLMDAKTLEWQWQHQVQIDAGLRELLATMMADRPQDRFASARAVLQVLQPFCQLGEVPTKPRRTARRALTAPALPISSSGNGLNELAAHATLVEGLLSSVSPAPQHPVAASPQNAEVPPAEALVETYLDLSPMGYSPALPESPTQIEPVDQTQFEPTRQGAIEAISGLTWSAASKTLEPGLSIRSLLTLAGDLMLRLPQDRLGNARSAQLSFKQLALWGILALLPLGGALVGIRSPHIASLCGVLGNCVGQNLQERYQQAIQQADSAGLLSTSARSLSDLQQARQRLADSIAQLSVFSSNFRDRASANLLPRYQTLLNRLDQTLEKETRANSLLNRAEAEAQKAAEQTNVAKTYQQYEAAQVEWRRALATLDAVPEGTFVSRQAIARMQEYKARLDALGVKLASLKPASVAEPAAAISSTQRTGNAVQVSVVAASPQATARRSSAARGSSQATQQAARPSAQASAQTPVRSSAPAAVRPQPRPTPTRQAGNRRPASSSARQTARQSPAARAAQPSAQTPSTSPLQVERQWLAGSVRTSATQTLKDVSVWIDGSRTAADGKLVANLWIQNRSGRGFGFVPLYAESRDSSGQTVRSRVLFTGNTGTGNAGTMLEPGKALSGQIYLLDRPSGTANLTLVVQESTEGNRTFRIPL